ncbi:hypothetical protein ACFLSQ_07420 [Bacteroidota bacterium]
MKEKSTFTDAGWDFEEIWNIDGVTNEGYPFLSVTPVVYVEEQPEFTESNMPLYPNPAGDYINISFGNKEEGSFLKIKKSLYTIFSVSLF